MNRLDSLLSRAAARNQEQIAVIDPSVAEVSYLDLDSQASRLAEILRGCGVAPLDRVGLYAPKSAGIVASIFGILRAGAAYVPVDPSAPIARSAEIMSDCSVKAVVTDEPNAQKLRESLDGDLPVVEELNAWGTKLLLLKFQETPTTFAPPDGLAYILYTSGSTGKPKGVIHTHASALSFVDWCSREFEPTTEDRFSSHAPFHFDLSILDLYVPIKHGGTIVLIGDQPGKTPRKLAPLISENAITVWYSTPSILRLLVENGNLEECDTSSLRLVLFAGEVFPPKHLQALEKLWPHPRYYNLYGPTETNVCTFHEASEGRGQLRSNPLPIGGACSDDELRIVDLDGQDVPAGEQGELWVAGGSVTLGYWNRPELTNASFVDDESGRHWYKTGDVVNDLGGGVLQFVGRRDRMVKRRGYRVELGEIESALYRHPNITEAAVVSLSDEDGGVVVKAFLTWSGSAGPSIIELKGFCMKNLPNYMVPDRFETLLELPKTSTDKVDYQELVRLG